MTIWTALDESFHDSLVICLARLPPASSSFAKTTKSKSGFAETTLTTKRRPVFPGHRTNNLKA
jgi:hypothetical protein